MASSMPEQPGFLKSTFPVSFPSHPALTIPRNEFESFVKKDVKPYIATKAVPGSDDVTETETVADETTTFTSTSSWTKIATRLEDATIESKGDVAEDTEQSAPQPDHPFMKALLNQKQDAVAPDMEGKMLTANGDVAYRSTKSSVVDLFHELEDVVAFSRLCDLLNLAWQDDALMTLKIIFNARSIHLGKSSRSVFYKCLEWLAIHHPATCILNLEWLSRPVIEKKAKKQDENDEDMVIVEAEKSEHDPTRYDVRNGVAHGYYKDLLNILALAVNHELSNPRSILNIEKPSSKEAVWDAEKASKLRHDTRDLRHETAVKAFNESAFYRILHIHVARIFAEQLTSDLKLLRSENAKAKRQISLCAKWAPSQKLFHDKHTFIVSSIAEIMHPQSVFPGVTDRDIYIRHAREAYRKDVAALRKALEVVERAISAGTFESIKYDRIPSLAMNNYAGLFAKKDEARFDEYLDNVAAGKKQISGAVLLPSTLVNAARSAAGLDFVHRTLKRSKPGSVKAKIEEKMQKVDAKLIDGQWKTLVQRIKDSGTLENSIAVCDVSGSMTTPRFPDGTCPMDSAIGLSLLIAEVTKPPFGGAFITFHEKPSVEAIKMDDTFSEKVAKMSRASWGGSTDFAAVFEKLILPMAQEHNLKQEDMVKRIFVFSDMQFNQATVTERSRWSRSWASSFERIQKSYKKAGYVTPELIFWNLAGGRAGYNGGGLGGDITAPKPVTADQPGTALVSGYSQGLLKVFLDNGSFEAEDEEEIVEVEIAESDGRGDSTSPQKKAKIDPLTVVKKAVSHKAYSMLQVVD